MKSRVVKKVERRTLVDKVCELQRDIDEYGRFHMDLLVMLMKRRSQVMVEHKVKGDDYMDVIWRECEKLVEENKELKAKLALQK